MARRAGKVRGDIRALEEQINTPQSNPIRGGSATPSMGLSQFRGGGDMSRMVGSGRGRKNEKEAHRLGQSLKAHLNQLHGSGYADAFAHGCSGGGFMDFLKKVGNEFTNPNSRLRGEYLPEASRVAAVAAPALDIAGTAVGLPGAGTVLSRGLSAAQDVNQTARNLGYGRRRGCGRESDDVRFIRGMGRASDSDSDSDSYSDEEYRGGQSFANPSSMSMSGAYNGQGRGNTTGDSDVRSPTSTSTKALTRGNRTSTQTDSGNTTYNLYPKKGGKRSPAGPNDGRRKRAEVVKRVMAEKGLKMIEASKYVKEHGLY